jgi:hypothetical protein
MPRKATSESLKAETQVIKASRVFTKLIASRDCLDAYEQQWQAIIRFHNALEDCSSDPGVVRQLLLRSQLLRQLCKCLSRALQQLASSTTAAAAAAALSSETPALALSGLLADCASLLIGVNWTDSQCAAKLADALNESGELCSKKQQSSLPRRCKACSIQQ